jgi:hypothetical protein
MLLCLPHGIESTAFRSTIARAFCQQNTKASGLQSTRLFALLAAKFLKRGETLATDAIFTFLSEVLERSKDPSADLDDIKRLLFVESRAFGEALRSDSVSSGSLAYC